MNDIKRMSCDGRGISSSVKTGAAEFSSLAALVGNMYQDYIERTVRSLQQTDKNVFMSSPYIDHLGVGLIITATLACYDKHGKQIGVVASDISLNSTQRHAGRYDLGQSYGFVTDFKMRMLAHPLLLTATAEPGFVSGKICIRRYLADIHTY